MRGLLVVLGMVVAATHAATIEDSDRQDKFLKLFDLIEFQNSHCLSDSGSEVGTCFTEKECNANQGKSIGSCAKGFGVCCQYIRSCDMDTCYNNTYFQNAAYPSGNNEPGMCMMTIRPTTDTNNKLKKGGNNATDVKCLKLEFEDFDILAPTNGDCTNDTFSVTGAASSASLPILCGVNTGNLMYVDTRGAAGPYKLNFNFGMVDYDRRWRIRVIQYTDESLCPPRNCLQYFTESMGSVMSFNNPSSSTTTGGTPALSQMINNLDYAVCFKSHQDLCDVALTSDEFDLGSGACADDYIGFIGNKVCGDTFADTQLNRTGLLAFQVVSDGDNSAGDAGFKIDYMHKACT